MLMHGFKNKFPYLELRLLLSIIASVTMVIFDGKLHIFLQLRENIKNYTYSLYYLYSSINHFFDYTSQWLTKYEKIVSENNKLRQQLLLKNSELLLLEQYKQENHRLKTLLNVPLLNNVQRKIIARVIFVNENAWRHQIIVDRGKNDNVYIGQPVITHEGIVGQVISVSMYSSKILSICDAMNALSVQTKKGDFRVILQGKGYNSKLYAEYSEKIDNIHVGEILVSSGLDGLFPEGYPVATIFSITVNTEQDSTVITASPIVKFKCLPYVILI